jgi:16S rRNA (guanine1207-N2)-methyltransferase
MGSWDEHVTSALLLAEWIELSPDSRVLCMHAGSGLAGIAAALQAPRGQVTLIDSHVVAVQAAQSALQANQVRNACVKLGDCGQPVHGESYDCVLAHLPKGRAAWEQTIEDAAQALRRAGTLYLAGANKAGIKTAAKYVKHVFGNVHVLAYRGGCRIVSAIKGPTDLSTESSSTGDYYSWRTVETTVSHRRLVYATRPGLFSWRSLDKGTRLLAQILHTTEPLRADDRVLDLGCGCGVLTLIAAQQAYAGQVVGIDVDCRAETATRRTLALNQIENADVLLGDCAEPFSTGTFSAVVTNPPFHQERATTYAVAEQIIREASRVLVPGGRLYLVANHFLRYKPMIEAAFGEAKLLAEDQGYKIWHATRARVSRA